MPGSSSQIRIEKVVSAGDDIESGAFLFGNSYGECIGELLAVNRIEHSRVQRASPQALRIPRRPRPRAGRGRGQRNVLGCGESHVSLLFCSTCRAEVLISSLRYWRFSDMCVDASCCDAPRPRPQARYEESIRSSWRRNALNPTSAKCWSPTPCSILTVLSM